MNIMLAFPNRDMIAKLKSVLVSNGFEVKAACTSGAQALAIAGRMEEGVIVCGIRFRDMMYHELKDNLPETVELIVIASSGQWDQFGRDDVPVLTMPFKKYDLLHIVDKVTNHLEKKIYARKHMPKKRTSKEQSIISEAKKMLMEIEGYTEEGAHRYLQKRSMDRGSSMVHTAEDVLLTLRKEGFA